MSAAQYTSYSKVNRNKRRSASDSGISCDSLKSCRYNIADFQNCNVVLFNENLSPGSKVNVLSFTEKKILTEKTCNRKKLLLSETESRSEYKQDEQVNKTTIKTRAQSKSSLNGGSCLQSPKKCNLSPGNSDAVDLRDTTCRNSDVSISWNSDIESGISSYTELNPTEQVKTNQNISIKKKLCSTAQSIDCINSLNTARSSVPRKTSDAICLAPKTRKRCTRNTETANVDVSFCESVEISDRVTENEGSSILKTTNEPHVISTETGKKRAQPNVQTVNGDVSVVKHLELGNDSTNVQNRNLRLGENVVENNRVQVTCNNRQFNSRYRLRKSNIQLSLVTSYLSYTVLDDNLPPESTEDLHLNLSTAPPSDSSINNSSLLDQSIKKECESHVDHTNRCGDAENTSPANHTHQTTSTDVFTDNSDREQAQPVRISSAEHVKRFPRKRSKLGPEYSASEDNTNTELSRFPNLSNTLSSSAKKVRKRNSLNSNSKLGTASTDTQVEETCIDTSLGATNNVVSKQNSVSVSVVAQAQSVPRKRGRPPKKRCTGISPSQHNTPNTLSPNSPKQPHNTQITTVSQANNNPPLAKCADDVSKTLLQKYTALLGCDFSPRVYLKRLETSCGLKEDPEASTSERQQVHIDANLTSEIHIKCEPESIEESDWSYNYNMSPLYIKMRPEDSVLVDITSSEKVVSLDYTSCTSHSYTASPSSALDYVVHRIDIPEHDNDANMRTVSSTLHALTANSNELRGRPDVSGDLDEMCDPETSVKSAKPISVTSLPASNENVHQSSDSTENCETSHIETQCNIEHSNLKHNSTDPSILSPDSSTTVNKTTKVLGKSQKLALKTAKIPKTKFKIENFVKSTLRNVSSDSKVEAISKLTDTEEESLLEDVKCPEGTRMSNSKNKTTSKLKHRMNSIENDEPIEPAVPVKVKKPVDKKKKSSLEDVKSTKKTEPKLKWKMKLGKHVFSKKSRKRVLEDSSTDEEENSVSENVEPTLPVEPSTTEVISKLEENVRSHEKKNNEQLLPLKELCKTKDTQKKTNDKDMMQKYFDKQKMKLDEKKETRRSSEYPVVEGIWKLPDKKQNTELENTELPIEPVTFETDKLKKIPKKSEKCRSRLENKEQPAPPKELAVDGKSKIIDVQKNSIVCSIDRLAIREPLDIIKNTVHDKNTQSELKRKVSLIKNNDKPQLQDKTEKSVLDNTDSKRKTLINPLENVNEPLSKYTSSVDNSKPFESHSSTLDVTKLPENKISLKHGKSHETTNIDLSRKIITKKPKFEISFDINKKVTISKDPFEIEGITRIKPRMDKEENFAVPVVPPRKRIRISFDKNDTNVEKKTLPSENNVQCDSCEDSMMEMEMPNTSQECSARNIHSFNFTDLTCVAPPEIKRSRKVKIKRPEMSDIVTRNVEQVPVSPEIKSREDDIISIYADTICNDTLSVKALDFEFEDEDEETPALDFIAQKDPNEIVSKWISDVSTNNSSIESRPCARSMRDFNREDEVLPQMPRNTIENIDIVERTVMMENTTSRPYPSVAQNHNPGMLMTNIKPCTPDIVRPHSSVTPSMPYQRPLQSEIQYFENIVYYLCKFVRQKGVCRRHSCRYQHKLPVTWETTLQNMPKESLMNLYNKMKSDGSVFIIKKIFPIVAKQLGLQKDFNSVVSLVKDVLEINMDSDRTLYINAIIDALRCIGLTFNSTIEVIFNSTFVSPALKDLLTDILIHITVEQGDIENNWPSMQLLMKHCNYNVDSGIIQTILKKCVKKSKLQKELCLKVYNDLISNIPDDKLETIFGSLLSDYIDCLKTLGLTNEAKTLYERSPRLPLSSSGSPLVLSGSTSSKSMKSVSEVSPIRKTSSVDPIAAKLPSPPAFSLVPIHIPPLMSHVPYRRPVVNKVMPWNNAPNLLLKDKCANVPSTSAVVAPYADNTQLFNMTAVRQAVFAEDLSKLMALILEYKEGDFTDEFLKTCLGAMQESPQNFAVLFSNLCQSVVVYRNEQEIKKDKSLEYVFKTIGTNLIIYSTHINKWEQAYSIYQTLRDLYSESDIINVKMLMADKPSYIKRLLIICRIFIKKDDCRHAWELFKVNRLHTSKGWSKIPNPQDIEYRDLVFTELLAALAKGKLWVIAFAIVEYILMHNIHELDRFLDSTLQMAINNDCHTEYVTSFMSVCPDWYNRIHCNTFRTILVKLVKSHMNKQAISLYRRGCEMEIYPCFFGNEKCIEFPTHFVLEELVLMLNIFLQKMINFMPIKHTVVIKVRKSEEITDETGTEFSKLLYQHNMTCETMQVRIVNILNNQIKPPIRVVNKYGHLEMTPAQLEKHLEVRSKWNEFC